MELLLFSSIWIWKLLGIAFLEDMIKKEEARIEMNVVGTYCLGKVSHFYFPLFGSIFILIIRFFKIKKIEFKLYE